MKTQQVVAPPRPLKTAKPLTAALNPQDADFLAHPHLTPAVDPLKGRLLRASATIRVGTVLLRDSPYAIVPLPTQGSLICSNLACSRRVAGNCARVVHCPRACAEDVVWCGLNCRNADLKRHEYECQWLKTQGQVCRAQESQYDFVTLWHVVRLLAGWSLELQKPNLSCKANRDRRFKWNWESVLTCCDYLDSWPEDQLKHWRRLAETYMMDKKLLPCPLNLEAMMSLICKEETNTFGLYPNVTGLMQGAQARGESYGLSLYPRAAQFNHSCRPNVCHKPDESNRMVYTAARDIQKGEECTITYFDLTAHESLECRQSHVQTHFRFKCTCERCVNDEAEENLAEMDLLPFCDI